MPTLEELASGGFKQEPDNRVGGLTSFFSGFASGLIDIPRGVFSLGASIIDLGLDSGLAAKVERAFDDIDPFDEAAEATAAGRFTKLLANIAIPGTAGFKVGSRLARTAVDASRKNKYFKLTGEVLDTAKEPLSLGQKLIVGSGSALGSGVADAIFTAETNLENFAPIFTEPLQLDYEGRDSAAQQLIRRAQFGTEGAVFARLIGGALYGIKSLRNRTDVLKSDNKALDNFFANFRPEGIKSKKAFELERKAIGARSADINLASQISREIDQDIDRMFPALKRAFDTNTKDARRQLTSDLNRILTTGKPVIKRDDETKTITEIFFKPLDNRFKNLISKKLGNAAKREEIDSIFDNMNLIRDKWGKMFTELGQRITDEDNLNQFYNLFGKKFKGYLDNTYEIFENKSSIPFLNYKPSAETLENFIKTARASDKSITREEALKMADNIVKNSKPPVGGKVKEGRTLGITVPLGDKLVKTFVKKTALDDIVNNERVGLDFMKPKQKKVVEDLLGKVDTPFATILNGTARLSMLTRRTQYYDDMIRAQDDLPVNERFLFPNTPEGIEAARDAFKHLNIRALNVDPGGKLDAGFNLRINSYVTDAKLAEAFEKAGGVVKDQGTLELLYHNFILYPKATSQLAKTVLSPVTHLRNLVSAAAFASANGVLFENPKEIAKAFRDSYRALDVPLKGARKDLAFYREMLKLGVVNTQVQARENARLLSDVNFGETLSSISAIKGMTKKLSKLKKASQDFYVAEDDFWKIGSFVLEESRLRKAYEKYGVSKTAKEIRAEAADIVRNNIPNYDMVNNFIQGLRKLPFGNFVSFPAEIIRTSVNILKRSAKEITDSVEVAPNKFVKPLAGIGYKRLAGFGITTTVIPYGLTETFKAAYNVTEDEMEALRRYVPEWSKNSTLIPIRGDNGKLKYVDFSHANAYDTITRPVTTLYNAVQRGLKDDARLDEEILLGVFESTKELGSPFISESIWTEAATDIIFRGGRTREGRRLYTDQTPVGEKSMAILSHIVESQMPGSVDQFKRLDLAIEPVDVFQKGRFDKYGRSYELGDEIAGLVGLRAVEVDPIKSIDFKIANFRAGVNNSRREFTSPLLRGGPVTPEQIVDRFDIANRSLYNVQKEFFKDYYAALQLGASPTLLDNQFKGRVSTKQLNSIKRGLFTPFKPSINIERAFRENARELGVADPYATAKPSVLARFRTYNRVPLLMDDLPIFENPFSGLGAGITDETTSQILPGLTTPQAVTTGVLPNNMQNTLAKIQTVDDFIKP